MNKKNHFIALFVIIFSFASSKAQTYAKDPLKGKYQMISDSGNKVTNNFKVFKNGKLEAYTIGEKQKIITFTGEYYVLNDSIYIESIDFDFYKKVQGEILPFKYFIKNDTLRQKGKVYYKANNAKNIYYKIPVDGYWLKVE